PMQASYFLGRETLVAATVPKLPLWRLWLFLGMARKAGSAVGVFRIPRDRVGEVGAGGGVLGQGLGPGPSPPLPSSSRPLSTPPPPPRVLAAVETAPLTAMAAPAHAMSPLPDRLPHLRRLESESIHIIREIAAECRAPVLLYSIGKDSTVLLHLAMKAFHPAKP